MKKQRFPVTWPSFSPCAPAVVVYQNDKNDKNEIMIFLFFSCTKKKLSTTLQLVYSIHQVRIVLCFQSVHEIVEMYVLRISRFIEIIFVSSTREHVLQHFDQHGQIVLVFDEFRRHRVSHTAGAVISVLFSLNFVQQDRFVFNSL